jgi:hypothetical protein
MSAANGPPEDVFLSNREAIDLHHGPHSTGNPDQEMEVIGCVLTARICDALMDMGLTDIRQTAGGFVAAFGASQGAGPEGR